MESATLSPPPAGSAPRAHASAEGSSTWTSPTWAKLAFALLCLLALLTHEHIFWFIAIVLAFIDIPDFLTPVTRIARSVETMAGQEVGDKPEDRSVPASPEAAIADKPGPKKEALRA